MPKIIKLFANNESLYLFSDDLMWGCRYYAKQSREASHDYVVFLSNTSCILLAASMLEAKINELIANVVGLNSETAKVPLPFWRVLHDSRKELSYKEKWNLIASASNGVLWDLSREPFQSYDLIVSLRNELVHYKGEYGKGAAPPVKKIEGLLQRFKGPGFVFLGAPDDTHWVTELLSAKGLAEWVSETVDEFDMKFDHLLAGADFSEHEKWIYEMQRLSNNPFLPSTT